MLYCNNKTLMNENAEKSILAKFYGPNNTKLTVRKYSPIKLFY